MRFEEALRDCYEKHMKSSIPWLIMSNSTHNVYVFKSGFLTSFTNALWHVKGQDAWLPVDVFVHNKTMEIEDWEVVSSENNKCLEILKRS